MVGCEVVVMATLIKVLERFTDT